MLYLTMIQYGAWQQDYFVFSILVCITTVPMIGRKSRTLKLLAFDEYCRFDTSAAQVR